MTIPSPLPITARENVPPRRRPIALTAVVALHIAALLVALADRAPPAPPPLPPALAIDAIPAPQSPPSPPSPAPVTTLAPITAAIAPPTIEVAETLAVASSAVEIDCRMLEAIAAAVGREPARSALATVPRSVAGAVMLWNGGWIDAGAPGPVREAIMAAIAAQPAACVAAELTGPRLVIVGNPATVLAVGAARWRWRDLLQPVPEARPS